MRTLLQRIIVPLAAAAALAGCDDDRNVTLPAAPTAVPANALSAFMTVSNPHATTGETVTITVRALRGSEVRQIGSFNLTVSYDSTRLRVLNVARSAHGMVLANTGTPGSLRAAGASGDGFTDDLLLTATFQVTAQYPTRGLALDVTELNSVGFGDHRSAMRVEKALYRAVEQ